MRFTFTRFYPLFLILASALALTACGGGGGSDTATDDLSDTSSTTTDTQQETGRHVYLLYDYSDSYTPVVFPSSEEYVLVAANCSELRFVEDNDGEIYREDNFADNATVTVTNGEVTTTINGSTNKLRSAGFGHCPQGIPGNGTTFASDVRCYDDNEILYLKAVQDQLGDGSTACTTAVGGSLTP